MRYITDEPIAAIATPLVPCAIGIIRTSGKNSITLVSRIFSRPDALRTAQSFTLVHGWITTLPDDAKSAAAEKCEKLDEVLLGVFRAPDGFSAEDAVEIYCHGGLAVIKKIFSLLLEAGFRQALPGEFTFRSFANGKSDLTRAEAVRELIEAKTAHAASHAVTRLSGDLFKALDAIKIKLVNIRARLEAETEYPEDENAFADFSENARNPQNKITAKTVFDDLRECESKIAALCESWQTEKLFQDGVRIVLAGKTNAGKSSLFNALLKEERSIVSDIHGTTRDYLEAQLDFAGLPVQLFDTAGLRKPLDAIDAIEKIGVERAKALALNADIVLYLIDATNGFIPSQEDKSFFAENKNVPLILVWTKCDLVEKNTVYAQMAKNSNEHHCFISVRDAQGLSKIADTVRSIVLKTSLSKNSAEQRALALGSERQKEAAFGALSALRHALHAFDDGFGMDAICEDIDDALLLLGEITGEVCTEDILDAVFSKFCLGK
ncbi:MAG: tRNA uridine-5-carboxymethylaminomethyl(34) synthesis GTPase MnmE [Treponemataceae bacterium]|nr:MAG: tRNA uridine-5-carboxymethylaminomethyl(34) synthesis GTPase MnmE [Treponemataceae bacterium]